MILAVIGGADLAGGIAILVVVLLIVFSIPSWISDMRSRRRLEEFGRDQGVRDRAARSASEEARRDTARAQRRRQREVQGAYDEFFTAVPTVTPRGARSGLQNEKPGKGAGNKP